MRRGIPTEIFQKEATTATLEGHEDTTEVVLSPWDKVPAELRLDIYKHCLCESRILEMEFVPDDDSDTDELRFYINPAKEPLLGVCHETRDKALKHGFFLFPDVYVRKHDILFLNCDMLLDLSFYKGKEIKKMFPGLGKVENVAIEWGAVAWSEGLEGVCPQLGKWMPNVKKVYIAIPGIRYGRNVSAVEPDLLKEQPAEISPVSDYHVLPDFYRPEVDEEFGLVEAVRAEGETLESSGQDLVDKVRAVFSRPWNSVEEVEFCLLHRSKLLRNPHKRGLLVFGPGATHEKYMTADEYNNTVARDD